MPYKTKAFRPRHDMIDILLVGNDVAVHGEGLEAEMPQLLYPEWS